MSRMCLREDTQSSTGVRIFRVASSTAIELWISDDSFARLDAAYSDSRNMSGGIDVVWPVSECSPAEPGVDAQTGDTPDRKELSGATALEFQVESVSITSACSAQGRRTLQSKPSKRLSFLALQKAPIYFNLGLLYMEKNDPAKAVEAYRPRAGPGSLQHSGQSELRFPADAARGIPRS